VQHPGGDGRGAAPLALEETQAAEEKNSPTWRPRRACDHGLKNPQHFVLRRYGCLRFPKS
jgi:hypothetical protein